MGVDGNNFSIWLEEQLELRGWRPSDLATAAGLSNATISRVLNGDRRAGPEVATAIAKALSLPPEFVFRQVGLLPAQGHVDGPSPSFQEIAEIMRNMTEDERREVVEYALFRFRRKGK